MLPGIIDVQSGTLDDPGALPARAQAQTAERIGWMERAHELPAFDRYPGQEAWGERTGSSRLSGQDCRKPPA